jgi:hypothetical protein
VANFLGCFWIGGDDTNGNVGDINDDFVYDGGYGRQKFLSVKQDTVGAYYHRENVVSKFRG